MNERKTAEIKFRVAPSEKARWQADAERLETPLSELIRKRMNDAAWDEQNKSLDGTKLVAEAVAAYVAPEWGVDMQAVEILDVSESQFSTILMSDPAASPQEDVSTSDEVVAKEEPTSYDSVQRYPWAFRG